MFYTHCYVALIIMENIVICKIGIETSSDKVFTENTLHDDNDLINSIVVYGEKIKSDGGEIFKHEKNIIATDKGYFLAFYESELQHA